jgi:hypothetical protein
VEVPKESDAVFRFTNSVLFCFVFFFAFSEFWRRGWVDGILEEISFLGGLIFGFTGNSFFSSFCSNQSTRIETHNLSRKKKLVVVLHQETTQRERNNCEENYPEAQARLVFV